MIPFHHTRHAIVDSCKTNPIQVCNHQAFSFAQILIGPPKAGQISSYRYLPIATAVSAMRLENPHSLSYQLRIRTIVASITLVWSVAKIEEWLSWLKSIDTNGSSVTPRMPAIGPAAA